MSSYSHIDQDDILKEVVSLIHQLDNTTNLNRVIDEVKQRRTSLGQFIKYELKPGDNVLVNGNRARKEEGTIVKLNRTRAVVNIDGIKWNVPFSMIETI
tara:strand:+ start:100 stop:396 length:297 start_codon:yes stop_codon:yes gene_type:complete